MSAPIRLEKPWQAICPDCGTSIALFLACTVADGQVVDGPKFEVEDLFSHAWKCNQPTPKEAK